MNDDRFLEQARRDPNPEFARRLRERLRADEPTVEPRPWLSSGLRSVLAGGLAVLAAVVVFTVPSVRASAQAFLDLFRVHNFSAVSFDPERMRQIEATGLDVEQLLGGQIERLKDPGEPKTVGSAGEAGAAAGFIARQPSYLPQGFAPAEVLVQGEGLARITVQSEKVHTLLDALDIRDVRMPPGLDGKTAMVRVHPAVVQHFRRGKQEVTLAQSQSPEVELPAGVDLATLGEIGLRILGLQRAEARRIAQTTDWHTTMLVPVPTDASSFQQVDVNGSRALFIQTSDRNAADGSRRSGGSVLLWSDGDRVFALTGRIDRTELVQMAASVR